PGPRRAGRVTGRDDAVPAGAAVLEALRARIEAATGRPVPGFDPRDGGTGARLLLLLETPGPRTRPGDLVTRDKPTPTGSNLRRFLGEAGLAREDMILWNAVPWLIHAEGARNRAPRAAELRAGLGFLPGLLDALPRLRVAVLAGRFAAAAEPVIAAARPELAVLRMPHPSPTIVCTSPAIPARIRATLAEAARRLAP
ncbi:MAG: uracil-DNA glycosylase, partial [Acetobacteraceae bacterium]|nr:uracil-DNA glycosylase [Acetobacteraceae bacterium]